MDPRDALRRYPLFALLGDRGLGAWLGEAEDVPVEPGQTLTRAGQAGEYAYLVRDGRVRVLSHAARDREVALGAFGPGEVLGEYALLPPHLDTATCRACEPGRVLRLPLAPLRGTIAGVGGVGGLLKNWLRLHALAVHLRGGAFLGFLSAPSVLPLLDRCATEEHRAGDTVQAPGLCADSWFYLRAGTVRLERPSGVPRVLGPGDCFGERALLGRGQIPRAEVIRDATLLRLTRDEFVRPLTGEEPSRCQTIDAGREAAPDTFEWVPQRTATTCGAAALTMAVRGAGVKATREEVAGALPDDDRGASLEAMARAAHRLGFAATVVRVAPHLLVRVRPPAVVHLSEGHYLALLSAGTGRVVLGDPASGILTWPAEQLARGASGAVLLLAPGVSR